MDQKPFGPQRNRTPKSLHLVFGQGIRLKECHSVRTELMPAGMTHRGFLLLLRALRVPTLEIGRTKYVDLYSLMLALKAVTRIGAPNFLAPACASVRRQGRNSPPSTLDLEAFRRDFLYISAELVAATRINGVAFSREVRELASEATQRMILASLQMAPLEERDRYAQMALAQARKEGILPDEELSQEQLPPDSPLPGQRPPPPPPETDPSSDPDPEDLSLP